MRRCEIAVGLVGVAGVVLSSYALVSLVIFLTLAVPFGLLFVLDTLVGERAPTRARRRGAARAAAAAGRGPVALRLAA